MNNHTTVFANLLSHLDRSEFENTVNEFSGDFRTSKLSTFNLLKTMIFGQITSAFSTREIESSLLANSKKLYHAGMCLVKKSTLCDALGKRDYRIFEHTFYSLVEKAKFISGQSNRRFRMPLKIIDATTLDLCLSRFNWAKFRKAKGAVKLHVKLDGDNLFPEQVLITTGKDHEVSQMSKLCHHSEEIYVMDKGYLDFKRLYLIDLQDSTFVIRMKTNCQFKTVVKKYGSNDESVKSDSTIKFTGFAASNSYPKNLRKVVYHDVVTNITYSFLTNNFELTAQEVAEIYKSRWQVELFFKWIKQNLKIKTFWGTSKNAVFIQIWVALIVALLLWIHKAVQKIKSSTQRIIQILKTTLFSKNTIFGLFKNYDPPPMIHTQQLVLWEAAI